MSDFLSIGSVIAFVIRVASVVLLGFVLWKQFEIFGRANVYKSEKKLKRLLFGLVVFTLLSNLPIMYLNIERAYGHVTSDNVTAVATIFNAASILVIAVILLIIYSSKDGQDGY
jgi:hypothetical protein